MKTFRVETNGQNALAVSGAITFDNAAEALRAAPQASRDGKLDVDLAALTDADSVSLAVLIAWAAQARERGGALRYLNAPQALRNLAHLSDVEDLLGL
jgi:phospholipid transport system transporter-binding protein